MGRQGCQRSQGVPPPAPDGTFPLPPPPPGSPCAPGGLLPQCGINGDALQVPSVRERCCRERTDQVLPSRPDLRARGGPPGHDQAHGRTPVGRRSRPSTSSSPSGSAAAAHRRRRHGRHRQLDPDHGERRGLLRRGRRAQPRPTARSPSAGTRSPRASARAPTRSPSPGARPIDPETVRAALRRKKYDAVTLVHNETSTGVMSPHRRRRPRDPRGERRADPGGYGLLPGRRAGRDRRRGGSTWSSPAPRRRIAVPPGLTVFTLSERAAERAAQVPHRGFYTDLLRYREKHREGGFITTPAHPAALRAGQADRQHPRRGDGGALGAARAALPAHGRVGRGARHHLRLRAENARSVDRELPASPPRESIRRRSSGSWPSAASPSAAATATGSRPRSASATWARCGRATWRPCWPRSTTS